MSRAYLQAEMAADYVSNTARIKTGNRPEGINRLPSERASTTEKVKSGRAFAREYFSKNKLTADQEVSLRAQVAEHSRAGNCTEHSAVAFEYLRKKGERGIAWISFPDHDHFLLVLGVPAKPPTEDTFIIGGHAPEAWGANAVVCDPWWHDWFYVRNEREWIFKISQILSSTSGRNLLAGEVCKVKCRAYV